MQLEHVAPRKTNRGTQASEGPARLRSPLLQCFPAFLPKPCRSFDSAQYVRLKILYTFNQNPFLILNCVLFWVLSRFCCHNVFMLVFY